MRIVEKSIFTGFIFAFLYSMISFSTTCNDLNNKVFRLHILANSNFYEDQVLKMNVKDSVQNFLSCVLDEKNSKEEAIEICRDNLQNINNIALEELKNAGSNYAVCTKITRKYFPIRNYGNITLPPGYYDALEIKLGSGVGRNWWCVVFPLLCVGVSQSVKKAESSFSNNEQKVCNNKKSTYKVKFKILEIYYKIKNRSAKNK